MQRQVARTLGYARDAIACLVQGGIVCVLSGTTDMKKKKKKGNNNYS